MGASGLVMSSLGAPRCCWGAAHGYQWRWGPWKEQVGAGRAPGAQAGSSGRKGQQWEAAAPAGMKVRSAPRW